MPVACVRRTTLAATDTTLAVMLSMVAWAVAAAVLLPWWRGCSVYVSSAPGLSMPGLVFSSLRSSRCVVFGEQYSAKPLVVQTKARTHGHTQHAHASTLPHRPSGSVAHRLTHRRVCGVSVDCEAHASQLASGQQQPQALAETGVCLRVWLLCCAELLLLLELPASSRAARPRTTPRTQQAHDMKRRDDCLFDLHPTQPGARASELDASLNDKKIMARSASQQHKRQPVEPSKLYNYVPAFTDKVNTFETLQWVSSPPSIWVWVVHWSRSLLDAHPVHRGADDASCTHTHPFTFALPSALHAWLQPPSSMGIVPHPNRRVRGDGDSSPPRVIGHASKS